MASPLLLALWGDGERELEVTLTLVLLVDVGGRPDGFGGRSEAVASADSGEPL